MKNFLKLIVMTELLKSFDPTMSREKFFELMEDEDKFVDFIIDKLEEIDIKLENIEVSKSTIKIDSEVTIKIPPMANYLIDFETSKLITDDMLSMEETLPYLQPATVVGFEDFDFKCNHCEHTHTADTIIYYPELDKKFRVAKQFLKLNRASQLDVLLKELQIQRE